ncbi:hypothetical protein CEXT_374721 [Caerostris extrusa]|uniref:Uncharacterized protein n=1 Tax=Caerostris extrusa TaxID=172846 RepID=A0AAV4XE37_CAEEX|nr:hypothetical protein CEXT_374721 [Caerostris extrusa]
MDSPKLHKSLDLKIEETVWYIYWQYIGTLFYRSVSKKIGKCTMKFLRVLKWANFHGNLDLFSSNIQENAFISFTEPKESIEDIEVMAFVDIWREILNFSNCELDNTNINSG